MNLFYVTSFITEKISKRVIEEEGIENFKIISDERYEPHSSSYIPAKKIYDIRKPPKRNILSNWKNIIIGSKKLSKISDKKFHIHIPHANAEFVRIALSHPNCSGFSFIEEGFTSYCKFGKINNTKKGLKSKIKKYVYYMGKISENRIYKKGYSKAYCISKLSFPGWERKKVIEPKFSKEGEGAKSGDEYCILVIDSMRTLSQTKQKIYISTLSKVVSILSKKYKKIKYKMHPDNYLYENDEIFKSIVKMGNAHTKEIDQKCSVERLAIGSGADVIVNLSSAGLYCLLFSDSNVYTFYDMFRSHAKMAGIDEENILGFERFVPDVFWENALPLQKSG